MSAAPHLVIVGGGAAGFFAAITAAEFAPSARVTLLEATAHTLAKVRISGGGRCNVTHRCFEPRDLVRRYPRGHRELLGAFTRFQPRDTIAWFAARGVELKTESDGRMFPVTDDSSTIVECLRSAAARARVNLRTHCGLTTATRPENQTAFQLTLTTGETLTCDRLLLATGGNKSNAGFTIAQSFGHTIAPPVPSLFTFHITDPRLTDLAGVSVEDAATSVTGTSLRERGPLLVTHWGLSGPAILKLSAWGARDLHDRNYRFTLRVNFAPDFNAESARAELARAREQHPRRQVATGSPIGLPTRLWERLVAAAGIAPETTWAGLPNPALRALATQVTEADFTVDGKSLFKDEFVTCGGIRLSEVDFKRMESRLAPGLHFAGEVLDIDGITGGFNFQAAWTTGGDAGRVISHNPQDPMKLDRRLLILTSLAAFGAAALSIGAQEKSPPSSTPATEKSAEKSRRPERRAQLTDEQRQKLSTLREQQREKARAIRDDANLTPEQKRAKLRETFAAARDEASTVLTPEQKKNLKQFRHRALEHRHQAMRAGFHRGPAAWHDRPAGFGRSFGGLRRGHAMISRAHGPRGHGFGFAAGRHGFAPGRGHRFDRGPRHGFAPGPVAMRGFGDIARLQLTDEQKSQLAELRKQHREQMSASAKSFQEQFRSLLTPEQQEKLERRPGRR